MQARLRRAGTDYPDDVRRHYLGNGPAEGQRAGRAGSRAGGGVSPGRGGARRCAGCRPNRRTPIDEALAIRDWVANRCTYSLAAPAIPATGSRLRVPGAHAPRLLRPVRLLHDRPLPGRRHPGPPGDRVRARRAGRATFQPARPGQTRLDRGVLPRRGLAGLRPDGGDADGRLGPDVRATGTPGTGGVPAPPGGRAGGAVAPDPGAAPVRGQDGVVRPLARAPARPAPGPRRALRPRRTWAGGTPGWLRILAGLGLPRGPAETPGEYAARARRSWPRRARPRPTRRRWRR